MNPNTQETFEDTLRLATKGELAPAGIPNLPFSDTQKAQLLDRTATAALTFRKQLNVIGEIIKAASEGPSAVDRLQREDRGERSVG